MTKFSLGPGGRRVVFVHHGHVNNMFPYSCTLTSFTLTNLYYLSSTPVDLPSPRWFGSSMVDHPFGLAPVRYGWDLLSPNVTHFTMTMYSKLPHEVPSHEIRCARSFASIFAYGICAWFFKS